MHTVVVCGCITIKGGLALCRGDGRFLFVTIKHIGLFLFTHFLKILPRYIRASIFLTEIFFRHVGSPSYSIAIVEGVIYDVRQVVDLYIVETFKRPVVRDE